jgi:uncharacterized membrane protein
MFDDVFFLALGLVALFYLLALPVMVFMLFARNRDLNRRISELEKPSGPTIPDIVQAPQSPSEVTAQTSHQSEAVTVTGGPWQRSTPDAEPDAPETAPRPRYAARFAAMLRENWVYAISAVSLALAGVFLVQYGAENGLLPPSARVAAALAFGIALIVSGDWLRRKSGDEGDTPTLNLPSVFSGAGTVSLYGGILAARVLYDLITPGLAFGGFAAVTAIALTLGWFYGPLLAAIGLVGGYAAPFILGGSSDTPEFLLIYFGLLAILGLGIDTVRRWAWISVLTVVFAFAVGGLLWLSDRDMAPWTSLYAAVLTLCAVVIPARSIWPDQGGRTILYSVLGRKKPGQPGFPVLLSAGSLLAGVGMIGLVTPDIPGQFWLSYGLLSALIVIFTVWSKNAPGLQDHPLVPVDASLSLLAMPDTYRTVLTAFQAERLPESAMPMDTVWILGLAALVTGVLAWRSGQTRLFRPLWAAAAAVYLPAIGLLLEYRWNPASVIGPYPWALHAIAVAAMMVFVAERFARFDGTDRTRASLATMSALATTAFTFSILFTASALTIALATVLVSAAALDRRFKLPLMEWFILAGITGLSYRLVVDPGLPWLLTGSAVSYLLPQAAATVACIVAMVLLRGLPRPKAQITLESAGWAFGGIFACTSVAFAIAAMVPTTRINDTHWGLGLYATVWLLLAAIQIWRLGTLPQFRLVRYGLAVVFSTVALSCLATLLTAENPFTGPKQVRGPAVLNTLIPAFLFPALVLGGAAWRLSALPRKLRGALAAMAVALASFWLFLTIRHVWQGAEGMQVTNGFTQPELYTYTLTLLIVGGALFYQSLARHSDLLRRAGLAVIALAIAKVFLIDISGLTGLTRVFSLLALGLMLAATAWVDRWAKSRGPI